MGLKMEKVHGLDSSHQLTFEGVNQMEEAIWMWQYEGEECKLFHLHKLNSSERILQKKIGFELWSIP